MAGLARTSGETVENRDAGKMKGLGDGDHDDGARNLTGAASSPSLDAEQVHIAGHVGHASRAGYIT